MLLIRIQAVANAENEVRNPLDDLQATGVLQPKNKMDIEALLNPHEELQMMDGARDDLSGCVGDEKCSGRRAHQWRG